MLTEEAPPPGAVPLPGPSPEQRIPNRELFRAVQSIMAEAPRVPGPLERRAEHFASRHPGLFAAYPRLLLSSCMAAAQGPAARAEFLRQLRFMLDRLSDIDEETSTAQEAADAVHGMLNERYVAPALERAEQERLAREREHGAA